MSFISNGNEVSVTGGKADVSGISGEISLQGYQYGAGIPDSGLEHDWDSTAQAFGDGESVTTLVDQQGTFDLSGSGTGQTGALNGNDAILLDGADDGYQDSSNGVTMGSGNEYTVATFHEQDSVGGTQTIIYTRAYEIRLTDSGEIEVVHPAQASYSTGVTLSQGDDAIVVMSYDGSTLQAQVEKSQVVDTTESVLDATETGVGSRQDGSQPASILSGQTLHYSEYKTDSERDEIVDALDNMWR